MGRGTGSQPEGARTRSGRKTRSSSFSKTGNAPLTSNSDDIPEYAFSKGCPNPLPLEKPDFTVGDIRAAIPAHCFERSLLRSSLSIGCDIVMISALYYGATFIETDAVPPMARYVLWPLYWVLQGIVGTGLWVMAHECGHQAFSDYQSVNDFVGLLAHSALLVPYHSWRITHRRHHSNTGSCENDEVFVPPSRSDIVGEMISETPLVNFVQIFAMLTVGWMPMYLVFNSTGPAKYRGKNASHFSPSAVMFAVKDRVDIIISDIGFFAALGALVYWGSQAGAWTVVKYYLIPYMLVNYHLVLITFLQHTDTYLPHFRGDEWDWLRGALCTVDRSFGTVYDICLHHISDTHVAHHLFSTMPHYHAQEATEAIKGVLGDYYLKDDTPIWTALWRAFSKCKFVEDDDEIVFYKKQLTQ